MVRGASKVDDGGKSKEDASGQSQVVRARSVARACCDSDASREQVRRVQWMRCDSMTRSGREKA